MTVVWNMDQVESSALFASLHPVLAQLNWSNKAWPTLTEQQALLDGLTQPPLTASGAYLRVVPQVSDKSEDWRQRYEPRIYLTGELQTRAGWHDVFNLLVWASFPRTKAALNARHYALLEVRAGNSAAPRLPPQDTLTQFDESGVIVVSADQTLSALLENFQWKALFCERRNDVKKHMRCYLFGHGLMEKALAPYRGMTGKGIVLPVQPTFFDKTETEQMALIDEGLAQLIADPERLTRPNDFAPVPVLGFPGFTPENENPAYYEDQRYFRPGRRHQNPL